MDDEVAIVHVEVAGQPVFIELEADAVFRRILAALGRLVEIGDVDRPVFFGAERIQRLEFGIGRRWRSSACRPPPWWSSPCRRLPSRRRCWSRRRSRPSLRDAIRSTRCCVGNSVERQLEAFRFRLVDLDLDAIRLARGVAAQFLVEVLVGVGLRHEAERSCPRHPRRWWSAGRSSASRVAGVGLGHIAELNRVALAGRAAEFVDHAPVDAR